MVGLVIDMTNETSDLVILGARDFKHEAVALIRIPHQVPPGFYGNCLLSALGASEPNTGTAGKRLLRTGGAVIAELCRSAPDRNADRWSSSPWYASLAPAAKLSRMTWLRSVL